MTLRFRVDDISTRLPDEPDVSTQAATSFPHEQLSVSHTTVHEESTDVTQNDINSGTSSHPSDITDGGQRASSSAESPIVTDNNEIDHTVVSTDSATQSIGASISVGSTTKQHTVSDVTVAGTVTGDSTGADDSGGEGGDSSASVASSTSRVGHGTDDTHTGTETASLDHTVTLYTSGGNDVITIDGQVSVGRISGATDIPKNTTNDVVSDASAESVTVPDAPRGTNDDGGEDATLMTSTTSQIPTNKGESTAAPAMSSAPGATAGGDESTATAPTQHHLTADSGVTSDDVKVTGGDIVVTITKQTGSDVTGDANTDVTTQQHSISNVTTSDNNNPDTGMTSERWHNDVTGYGTASSVDHVTDRTLTTVGGNATRDNDVNTTSHSSTTVAVCDPNECVNIRNEQVGIIAVCLLNACSKRLGIWINATKMGNAHG